jgi:DNA polymerase
VPKAQAPQDDAMEDWWRSYYASTFNPARVNPEMMRSEMPVRYWKNLPEASLIPGMIAAARARTGAMLDTAPTEPRKNKAGDIVMREFFASDAPQVGLMAGTLAALRAEAASCRRCPLYGHATQTVFGEGPERAPVVFVGEQPGDQEDLGGRPFVGPAGQMFDRALAEAGIARPMVYVTNAVKHFKFVPRGKKRIHQKPNAGEVEHCRWWLERELALIQPKLVVALGATAVKALIGKDVKITEMRGRLLTIRDGLTLVATVHPSYLLRLPDAAAKAAEYGRFVEDLTAVARYLPEIAKAA